MSGSFPFLDLPINDGGTNTPPDSPLVAETSSPRAENNNLQESLRVFAVNYRVKVPFRELPDEDILLSFARVLVDEFDGRSYNTVPDLTEENKTVDHDIVIGDIKPELIDFVVREIARLTESRNDDPELSRMASQIRSLLFLEDVGLRMRNVVHSLYKIYQSKVLSLQE